MTKKHDQQTIIKSMINKGFSVVAIRQILLESINIE